MDKYRIVHHAAQELASRKDERIDIVLRPPELTMLIAQLQVALRHPENQGPSADVVRRWCQEMINRLAPRPGPLREALLLGYNPMEDLTRGTQEREERHGG
jgi:hypothetical protein